VEGLASARLLTIADTVRNYRRCLDCRNGSTLVRVHAQAVVLGYVMAVRGRGKQKIADYVRFATLLELAAVEKPPDVEFRDARWIVHTGFDLVITYSHT
jgi:hypothetical protein